jgi:hypothetical protein
MLPGTGNTSTQCSHASCDETGGSESDQEQGTLEKSKTEGYSGLQGRKSRIHCASPKQRRGDQLFDNMVGDPEKYLGISVRMMDLSD